MIHRLTPTARTISVITFSVLIVGAVIYRMYAGGGSTASHYTVARVTRGDVVLTVNAVGQLGPVVSVEISSQISGLVTAVYAQFNNVVHKGQTLAQIDSSTYAERLRQAEADLQAATAEYTRLTLRSKRLTALLSQDLVAQQDYDDLQSEVQQARANLLTRKAAVANARVDLERCTIRSPIDGVVIYKQIEVGKTVVSSLSAPTLFTIAKDLSKLQLVAPISEVDVTLLRPGQDVRFAVDAFAQKTFDGKLVAIRSPYVPSDRQLTQAAAASNPTFDAVVEIDNADLTLRPSLTAVVYIVVDKRIGVLRVPSGALRLRPANGQLSISSEDSQVQSSAGRVYVLESGSKDARPRPVQVELGISDDASTEIVAGLKEGDTVVTGTLPVDSRRSLGLFL